MRDPKTLPESWRPLFLAGFLAAAALPAQQGPLSLELSFSNPGARSMGFGGAFVALADDATAAFANPAGLVQLTRREVSIEGRLWNHTTPFTEGGRLIGRPTGLGLDTAAGLRFGETSAEVSGLSFLSYVYPEKRWAFALYRHQLAKFESFSETQGFFFTFGELEGRTDDFLRTTELDVTSHALAFAYRASERLSLGFTLAIFESDAAIVTESYSALDVTLPDGLFGRNAYHPAALEDTLTTTSDGGGLGVGAGLLWRASARWSFGASYRQGPELDFETREVSGPALAPFLPAGTLISLEIGTLRLPDVWSLGAAYRSPGGRLTVAFEWDRVKYATIVASIGEAASDATLDDGDELHLGAEWILPGSAAGSTPIVALRAGAWIDPDHRIRFTAENVLLDRAIFRGGSDELHLALGAGVAFERFQIDAALDFSDLVDTASLSAIYSF